MELVGLQGTGTALLGAVEGAFDGDKLRSRGNLAVDVRCDFGLVAGSVKALIALHVRKQAGVVSAAARAGDTGSRFGLEGGVLAVERGFRKVQVEVGLNPCAQELRGK